MLISVGNFIATMIRDQDTIEKVNDICKHDFINSTVPLCAYLRQIFWEAIVANLFGLIVAVISSVMLYLVGRQKN